MKDLVAIVGTLVILASAVVIVVTGMVLGVRVLWRAPGAGDFTPTPALRDIALALLLGVGGVVAGSILTVAAWVAERELQALEPYHTAVHLGAGPATPPARLWLTRGYQMNETPRI
jgi:hypothetical protein